MQDEPHQTDHSLGRQQGPRNRQQRRRRLHPRHEQEATSERGRHDRDPFGPVEEAVLRVVEQGHAEIPDEAAEGEQHDPPPDAGDSGRLHPQEKQEQPNAHVGQRRDERCGIDQVAKRLLLEERALEVEDHAGHSDQDRARRHAAIDGPPRRPPRPEDHRKQQQGREGGETDRAPIRLAARRRFRRGREDVEPEEGQISRHEPLDAALGRDSAPRRRGSLHVALRSQATAASSIVTRMRRSS